MRLYVQDIKREIRLKAVLFGFLAYFVIELIAAVIVGGGWGLYTLDLTRSYIERCGTHCDPKAVEAYITSATAPYRGFINFINIITSLVSLLVLPVLAGFIAGRRAKNAEVINSAVLGAILIFYSMGSALLASNIMRPDATTASNHAIIASRMFAVILLTIPVTVLGGILAQKKNITKPIPPAPASK